MSPHKKARSGILAAGNFIVDHVKLIDRWPAQDNLVRIIDESLSNGGGPYNLLKDLALLGAPFPLAAHGLLGDDPDGRAVRSDCADHGIDVSRLSAFPGATTSYTDAMTVSGSGRRTFFHKAGANARLGPGHFDFSGSTARIFYLGHLLLLDALDAPSADGRPASAGVLARARSAGLLTAVDCISEDSGRYASAVAPALPEVDVLFANDFEAEKLTGRAFIRDSEPDLGAIEAAARALLAKGVRSLVVLHFPQGALAASADGAVTWQPAVALPAAEMAGSGGAGDALAAGVLYALHEGWPTERGLLLGVCAATASLRNPSCSGGVGSADACLALGKRNGFLPTPG